MPFEMSSKGSLEPYYNMKNDKDNTLQSENKFASFVLLGKAKIISYYTNICHDCITVVLAVNSVKCRKERN